ncbi:MAG: DMT family transporter [Ancalomicrobiaceae bacterium]|nr:DMT family transporter [Ancalomicrobiaceae bacterium]
MTASLPALPTRTMAGIGHALVGFSVFSIHDAAVKWLVASLPVWEILFFRSIVIVALTLILAGGSGLREMVLGPNRKPLLVRSALILAAWLAFFTAARSLHFAELITIYFAAPLFGLILSIVILKEHVGPWSWGATMVGFAGVVIASGPSGSMSLLPVLLTLLAAFLWGCTNVLIRLLARSTTTLTLMLASNCLFIIVCGASLPWTWVMPDAFSLGLMLSLGLVGGLGQYFLFEGYRLAPVSTVAPLEYVSLIWAFAWGYVIWGDVPVAAVLVGAALILASGLALIWSERGRGEPAR